MQDQTPDRATPDVAEWAEGAHHNAADLAAMLGVTHEQFTKDPLALLPGLQNYVSRLPLDQFEQSDWITLHSDLTSYLADVLVRRRNATWQKVDDSSSPTGSRFFIVATGIDGAVHQIEPYDVVMFGPGGQRTYMRFVGDRAL